ncbi:hypothetical protein ACU8KH_00326 [Lachancea thermotolerans]
MTDTWANLFCPVWYDYMCHDRRECGWKLRDKACVLAPVGVGRMLSLDSSVPSGYSEGCGAQGGGGASHEFV